MGVAEELQPLYRLAFNVVEDLSDLEAIAREHDPRTPPIEQKDK